MSNTIQIIIKGTDNASPAINNAKKSTEGLNKQTELMQKGFKAAAGAIAAFGVKAVFETTGKLLEQGLAINKAEKALEGFTGSAEEAEKWTRAVKRAGDGALTTFDSVETASRFAAMGLAANSTEAGKLAEMAVTLGAAMGNDAGESIENFSLMLANQSIPRLDTFGISGAAVRQRMQELSEATGETDRQLLFLNATMEIGTQKLNELDAAGFEAVDNVQRFKTWIDDSKQSLSQYVANGLMPYIDGIYAVKNAAEERQEQTIAESKTYEDYIRIVKEVQAENIVTRLGVKTLGEEEYNTRKESQLLEEQMELTGDAIEGAGDSADTAAETGISNLNEKLAGTTRAVDDVNLVMQSYTDKLLFQIAAANLDADAQWELAQKMGLVDEKTWIAYEAIQGLNGQLQDGKIEAGDYRDGVLGLQRALNNLDGTSVTTTVITEFYEKQITSTSTGRTNTARQVGGAVSAGTGYIVGERGPEWFTPSVAGRISPSTYNYNLTINNAGRTADPGLSFAMLKALSGGHI